MGRNFHPWEGGEGKVPGQYVLSLVEKGKQLIAQSDYADAIAYLERAQEYPHNLGEGKLTGAQENHIFYYLGCAYEGLADTTRARGYFERASIGQSEPTSAMYYNDQPPDMIFYQGLAYQKLSQNNQAREIFNKLVNYGQRHLTDEVKMDYFAVSLPNFLVFDEDLSLRHQIHCQYMMALGYLGLADTTAAEQYFTQVLTLDANHLGATVHKLLLQDQDTGLA
jgi:tetratricopeptide (TPR) repeat protein